MTKVQGSMNGEHETLRISGHVHLPLSSVLHGGRHPDRLCCWDEDIPSAVSGRRCLRSRFENQILNGEDDDFESRCR